MRALVALVLLCGCGQILGLEDPVVVRDGAVIDAPSFDAASDGSVVDAPTPPIDAPMPPIDGPTPPIDGAPPSDGPTPPIDAPMPPIDGSSPLPPDGGFACMPGSTQCTNCIDDDSDGVADGADSECTGATDNDEGSFATGIPGDNLDSTTQDCFFDGNTGGGDDGCAAHECCLLGGCNSTQQQTCTPSSACLANCLPITVAGCDCYGCCTICNGQGCFDVAINPSLSPSCDASSAHDPTLCLSCTKNTECVVDCGAPGCELCPGQTPADLPGSCTDPTCDLGRTMCEQPSSCGPGGYCSNSCCIP